MRTRFLNIDYFSHDQIQIQFQETLTFLHLPLPRLPSPPPTSAAAAFEHNLRFDSSLGISLQADTFLPIDSVLSKFLSDVLPHRIDAHFQGFDAAVSSLDEDRLSSFATGAVENRFSQLEEGTVYEDNEVEDSRNSVSEAECPQENTRTAPTDKNECACKMIPFETPELDVLLENACFPLENWMQMLSETPRTENHLQKLKLELSTRCFSEVLESISLVQDVIPEYLMEQNANSLEKNISVQNLPRSSQSIFPILEVDEDSLGFLKSISVIENVCSHFGDIRPQSFDEKCHSIIEGRDLLGSKKNNIMDFLSDCLSKQSLVLSDMLPARDFIMMLETEHINQNSTLQGMLKTDSASSANLFTFKELVFLDVDLIQYFEVLFDKKALNDPEISSCMFVKMFPFKSFDELIVSNEIALIDDTFKSLAVPVISDYGKITSLCVIIGEMISNLKTQTLSASNGIYLNWGLFEDKCNCKIYHLYQNMWAKIDLININFEEQSFDYKGSVFDLVFSCNTIGGCEVDQSEELLRLLSDTGVASSKLLDDGSTKQGNQELLAETVAGRASLFFRSMSETSNIDYFLDPQKATAMENCKFAVESADAGVHVQKENVALRIFDAKESMKNQKLVRKLNFCPIEKTCDTRFLKASDKVECLVPPPIPAVKSENGHQRMESLPGTVIIVNTQNADKEMIVSRRSTYQVILAMEKEGIQVVERDLDFPVDIIISSAICLVWYDYKNLGKKETSVAETSSSFPLCIDDIATNVLTVLSFSFQGCFMVFEGEFSFLSSVMESSDGLYAAAASLGIDLQIFFSYSLKLTNEIIVSCINYASTLTRGLYFKMPDSVTLAESFLTRIPSVNPLTAHAILSSGTKLSEFLEWSHERRINYLEKYHVPEESLALFSVFCRYGEREDSKSIMTDCCSSVSSGADSDMHLFYQTDNERNRRKHTGISQKDEVSFDEFLQTEPLEQVVDGNLDSFNPSLSCKYGLEDAGQSRDLTNNDLSMSDLFGHKRMYNATKTGNNSKVSQPLCDSSWNCEAHRITDQLKQSSKDKESIQHDTPDTAILSKKMTWHGLGNSENLHENIAGKAVALTDDLLLDNNSLIANTDTINFPSLMTETERDQIRKSKLARFSYDQTSHSKADSSRNWRFLKDTQGEVGHYLEPDFLKDVFPPSTSEKLHEDITGEVVDFMNFPSLVIDAEKEQRRNNKLARGLSLNKSTQHEESFSNIWTQGSVDNFQELNFGNDDFPLDVKHREKIFQEGFSQEPMRNTNGLPFQKEISHLGRTPLSRALRSASPIESSPWRMEFLNKVKEKRKILQKSISCGNSAPFWSGNMSKMAKRSPSTIDSFRYRGDRTPGVISGQKKQKQSVQSSNSANKRKLLDSKLPTLIHKKDKATKTRTLATNKSDCQTKLVWSDGTLGLSKKLRFETQ